MLALDRVSRLTRQVLVACATATIVAGCATQSTHHAALRSLDAAAMQSTVKRLAPGYNSFMGHDPENNVTLVVWTNLAPTVDGHDPATTIARELIGLVYASPR
jgi:hypothetical protein